MASTISDTGKGMARRKKIGANTNRLEFEIGVFCMSGKPTERKQRGNERSKIIWSS
jgi:hypothetical protein